MKNRLLTKLNKNNHGPSILLLRRLLFVVMLASIIIKLPNLGFYFSPDSVPKGDAINDFLRIFTLLQTPPFSNLYFYFIGFHILVLLTGIMGYFPRSASIILFFTHGTLCTTAPYITDAGDNLTWIFLSYLSLMSDRDGNWYENIISNIGLMLARLQVCYLYLFTGIIKLTGPLWQKGVALFYVLKVPEFTHPIAEHALSNNLFYVTLGTYATIAFQPRPTTFP